MTIAHVQSASSTAWQTATSVSQAFSATVGSGNAVVGFVTYDGAGTLNSVTDDKGNSYSIKDTINDAADSQKVSSFVRGNITNAPKTITANFAGSTAFVALGIDEYSGITAATDPSDGHAAQLQQSVVSGTNALSSTNITPTTNGDLIYGITFNTKGSGSALTTVNAGTGFTRRIVNDSFASFFNQFYTEDQIQSTAASIAATFSPTTTSTTESYTTFVIALKAAAPSGDTFANYGSICFI